MPTYYESWKRTCDEVGLSFPKSKFYETAGMSVVQIFQMLIQDQLPSSTTLTPTHCEERKKYHHAQIVHDINNNSNHNKPIDVVINIVKKYHERNIPIAIASSGWKDHIINGLEQHNLLPYFDEIVTVEDDDVKHGKPDPDLYYVAAERLGVDVKDCIGFEDADLGMESIQRAGYLYACDVRLFYDYPRNVEKRNENEVMMVVQAAETDDYMILGEKILSEDKGSLESVTLDDDMIESRSKDMKNDLTVSSKTDDNENTTHHEQPMTSNSAAITTTETINLASTSSLDDNPSSSPIKPFPSNDDDNFARARELVKQAMLKDKDEFFVDEVPLTQKEILQSILLAEDAAINGLSDFSTKDKLHYLEKVHVPSIDEEGGDLDDDGEKKWNNTIHVPEKVAAMGQKAIQFISGLKDRRPTSTKSTTRSEGEGEEDMGSSPTSQSSSMFV